MLYANTTKDLNQSARAAVKFLKEFDSFLTHSQSLDMVSRMLGYPHHMAAQAALTNAEFHAAVKVNTWRQLRDAINQMNPEQLDMSLSVSEGCDSNGDAEFYPCFELLPAGDDSLLAASDGVLEPRQPVLLFGVDPADAQTSWMPDTTSSLAVAMMSDLSTLLSSSDLQAHAGVAALSKAAVQSMALAVPYLPTEHLERQPLEVLQAAYNDIPVGVSAKELLEGAPNADVSSTELALATRIARAMQELQDRQAVKVESAAPAEALSDEDLERLAAQFEMATGFAMDRTGVIESASRTGLTNAVDLLCSVHDCNLGLGPWIISSAKEQGFWSENFGWVFDRRSATGYDELDTKILPWHSAPDACFVQYNEAKDFSNE